MALRSSTRPPHGKPLGGALLEGKPQVVNQCPPQLIRTTEGSVHQLVGGTSTKVADAKSSLAKRLAGMNPACEAEEVMIPADEAAAAAGSRVVVGASDGVGRGGGAGGGGGGDCSATGGGGGALVSTRVVLTEEPPPWQRGVAATSDAWEPLTITIDLGDEPTLGIELDDYVSRRSRALHPLRSTT